MIAWDIPEQSVAFLDIPHSVLVYHGGLTLTPDSFGESCCIWQRRGRCHDWTQNGVATKWKDRIPHLVAVHCVAHRLALATSHSCDSISCIKKIQHQVAKSLLHFSK